MYCSLVLSTVGKFVTGSYFTIVQIKLVDITFFVCLLLYIVPSIVVLSFCRESIGNIFMSCIKAQFMKFDASYRTHQN